MAHSEKQPKPLADLARELGEQIQGPEGIEVTVVIVDLATGNVGWATTSDSRARTGIALKAVAQRMMD